MKFKSLTVALVAATVVGLPAQALAWGAEGHRMIGVLATEALPTELPAFLRRAGVDVGELSREPDRSRGAGKMHDTDRDAAHFVDIDDNGTALGGPALNAMPPLRSDYEKALQAAGPWRCCSTVCTASAHCPRRRAVLHVRPAWR